MAELGAGSGSGYPAAVDTKQTYSNVANPVTDSPSRMDAEVLNDALDAIVKLQTELGVAPSGVWASVAARLDAFLVGSVAVPQLVVAGAGPHAIGGATSAGVGLGILGFTGPSGTDTYGLQLTAPTTVGTPTNAATLRIVGAPTGATNNYALWVAAGNIRLAGDVGFLADTAVGPGFNFAADVVTFKSGTDRYQWNNQANSLERMRLTDGGILALGTTNVTNAVAGDARLAKSLWIGDGVTAPTAQAGFAVIYVDAADGDLKVKFGDGVTKVLAADV